MTSLFERTSSPLWSGGSSMVRISPWAHQATRQVARAGKGRGPRETMYSVFDWWSFHARTVRRHDEGPSLETGATDECPSPVSTWSPQSPPATMVEHLHRYGLAIDLCDDKVVLDIASGEGYGSSLLAGRALKVYGIDISNEAVEHTTKKCPGTQHEIPPGPCRRHPGSRFSNRTGRELRDAWSTTTCTTR